MQSFGWIKNPLSIIAIFISLIYGISGLLFGFSVTQLTPENQNILVYFIVVFPFTVLGVFAWLVAKHHHKLYGPGDYRADDIFARTFPTATPSETASKIEIEIQNEKLEQRKIEDEPALPPAIESDRGKTKTHPIFRSSNAASAYLLSNLAIQEIEREVEGTIRREVRLSDNLIADGIFETQSTITIVEIKVLDSDWYAFTAIQAGTKTLQQAESIMRERGITKKIDTLLVLVVSSKTISTELPKLVGRLEMQPPTRIRIIDPKLLMDQSPNR